MASDLLKELTLRPRPFLTLDHVWLLVPAPDSYAFPSGHATDSFAAASGLAFAARRLLGRVPAWGWAALALSAAVSYSRVYVGVHWSTDVAAGVVLGVFCGWAGDRLALLGRGRPAGKPRGVGGLSGDPREVECGFERR